MRAERDRRNDEANKASGGKGGGGRRRLTRRTDARRVQVKLGHGGTLDPLATGVLVAGVGRGTKQLPRFIACSKTYEAVVLFSAATDTYDREGRVVARAPHAHLSAALLEQALRSFRGRILQRPPIFSALSVRGKRLYEYARRGERVPVPVERRPVTVERLELLEWLDGAQHAYELPAQEADGTTKAMAESALGIAVDDASAAGGGGGGDGGGSGKKASKKQQRKRGRSASPAAGVEEETEEAGPATGRKRKHLEAEAADGQKDEWGSAGDADSGLLVSGEPQEAKQSHHDGPKSLAPAAENETRPSEAKDGAENSETATTTADTAAAVGATATAPPNITASPRPASPVSRTVAGGNGDEVGASAAQDPMTAAADSPTAGTSSNAAPQPSAQPSQPQPSPPLQPQPPPSSSSSSSSSSRPPAARLRMTVSSGFYVRSLCHDLGHAMGSLGFMAALVRTRQGQFALGGYQHDDRPDRPHPELPGEAHDRHDGGDNNNNDQAAAGAAAGGSKEEPPMDLVTDVLEWDDLAKGEEVWGPKVARMLDRWNANEGKEDE